jgi:nucleoside-diphosphate-sugar epimerase
MKIAILGARGFLGQKLCLALIAQGHEVTGFVLNPGQEMVGGINYKSVMELLELPISSASPFDISINLAARRSTRNLPFTDSEVHNFTYEIPKEFILRTSNPQTIVVNASTYIQNFEGKSGQTVDTYGAAKEKLSHFLENESRTSRFETKDLFFFTLYGIGDKPNHLVPLLLNAAKSGDEIALSPGHQLMNLLYVNDAVQNILNCISQKPNATYCKNYVWSREYFSVRDLVGRIQSTIGLEIKAIWGGREYVGHEMMQPWPIPMSQLPSFSAPTDLEKGIKQIWNAAGAV